jgi:hypothetical protein
MSEIKFTEAKEFAEFVAAQPALGESPKCVFCSEVDEQVHRFRSYGYDDTVTFTYHALIPIHEMGKCIRARLSLTHLMPHEWATMSRDGILRFSCSTKKDLVEFLKKIEVSDKEIAKLNKATVSSLREIVDNSPTKVGENEEFEEIVYKLKKKGDVVKLNSGQYGKVTLMLTRERHTDLIYKVRADWGTALAALLRSVDKELTAKKLKIYKGAVNVGS